MQRTCTGHTLNHVPLDILRRKNGEEETTGMVETTRMVDKLKNGGSHTHVKWQAIERKL